MTFPGVQRHRIAYAVSSVAYGVIAFLPAGSLALSVDLLGTETARASAREAAACMSGVICLLPVRFWFCDLNMAYVSYGELLKYALSFAYLFNSAIAVGYALTIPERLWPDLARPRRRFPPAMTVVVGIGIWLATMWGYFSSPDPIMGQFNLTLGSVLRASALPMLGIVALTFAVRRPGAIVPRVASAPDQRP